MRNFPHHAPTITSFKAGAVEQAANLTCEINNGV
jgi:hypothetical protein